MNEENKKQLLDLYMEQLLKVYLRKNKEGEEFFSDFKKIDDAVKELELKGESECYKELYRY